MPNFCNSWILLRRGELEREGNQLCVRGQKHICANNAMTIHDNIVDIAFIQCTSLNDTREGRNRIKWLKALRFREYYSRAILYNYSIRSLCALFWRHFLNTIFVSNHMFPENPEGTEVMNMGYDIYPTLPEIELTTSFAYHRLLSCSCGRVVNTPAFEERPGKGSCSTITVSGSRLIWSHIGNEIVASCFALLVVFFLSTVWANKSENIW